MNEAAPTTAQDTSRSDERRRILAARGWETERERAHALRELLAEPLPHIFLFSYSQLRHRDRALQHTRDLLVWLSRHLADVPEDRPLDHWIFDRLATDGPTKLPLRLSELGPEPTQVLTEPPNQHYLQSYPTTRQFLAAYQEYRRLPSDEALRARAGWAQAERDLRHFIQGHFSEEGADTANARVPMRIRMKRSIRPLRVFQFLLLITAVTWISVLRHENAELRAQLSNLPQMANGDTRTATRSLGTVRVDNTSTGVALSWARALGAERYSVVITSQKMDTLCVRDSLLAPRCDVPFTEVPAGQPFLYRIDAWTKNQKIASSGMVAYPPI